MFLGSLTLWAGILRAYAPPPPPPPVTTDTGLTDAGITND